MLSTNQHRQAEKDRALEEAARRELECEWRRKAAEAEQREERVRWRRRRAQLRAERIVFWRKENRSGWQGGAERAEKGLQTKEKFRSRLHCKFVTRCLVKMGRGGNFDNSIHYSAC